MSAFIVVFVVVISTLVESSCGKQMLYNAKFCSSFSELTFMLFFRVSSPAVSWLVGIELKSILLRSPELVRVSPVLSYLLITCLIGFLL